MITSISKTEQLKSLILKDIRSEVYRPGDSLPSIRDLCRRYGVSKHTVSQALSNMNELGIIDLTHGKTTRITANPFRKHIELIYASNTQIELQEFWSEFYRGIVDEFHQNHDFKFSVRTVPVRIGPGTMENIDVANTAGALVLGSANQQLLDFLRKYEIPFVMVYDRVDDEGASFVTADLRGALIDMVKLFRRRGCLRPAYIGAFGKHTDQGINIDKMKYFKEALTIAGMTADESLFRDAEHTMQSGYEVVKTMLSEGLHPDGLFVASDILAVGAYRAMYEFGFKPGVDIAVGGCDNLQIGNFLIPSLTTIELHRYRQGRLAAKRIIKRINDHTENEIREVLPAEIIIRESLT